MKRKLGNAYARNILLSSFFFFRHVICNFHPTNYISLINVSVDIKLTYGVCEVFSLRHPMTVSVKKETFNIKLFSVFFTAFLE